MRQQNRISYHIYVLEGEKATRVEEVKADLRKNNSRTTKYEDHLFRVKMARESTEKSHGNGENLRK